jgi:DNA replication protein DnaC
LSGLKAHERDHRLSDLYAFNTASHSLIQAVEQFIASPRGWLYIWGPPGNGKTLALQVIVNELLEQDTAALYITFSDLLDLMRQTFGQQRPGEDTFSYRFERLQSIAVLAIDEFDKVNQTEFVREFRSKLVDHRYRDAIGGKTATLFAANQDPSLLPDWIADRVGDGRFRVLHNPGRSVRAAMTW